MQAATAQGLEETHQSWHKAHLRSELSMVSGTKDRNENSTSNSTTVYRLDMKPHVVSVC